MVSLCHMRVRIWFICLYFSPNQTECVPLQGRAGFCFDVSHSTHPIVFYLDVPYSTHMIVRCITRCLALTTCSRSRFMKITLKNFPSLDECFMQEYWKMGKKNYFVHLNFSAQFTSQCIVLTLLMDCCYP